MFNKKIIKVFAIVLSLASSLISSPLEIKGTNLFAPGNLKDIKLFHDENGFVVESNSDLFPVQDFNVDKSIRNISDDQLTELLGSNNQIFIPLSKEEVSKIDMTQVVEMTKEEKEAFMSNLPKSAYISVKQANNGEYILQINHRLIGGGVWGAIGGAWLGKFVASAVVHTAIWGVSAVASLVITPAGGALLGLSLESTFGVAIEATTTAVALAAGIAGGVVTGPI